MSTRASFCGVPASSRLLVPTAVEQRCLLLWFLANAGQLGVISSYDEPDVVLFVLCSKREYKIKNLEAECAKISAKERSEGGLTQGQASTLVRQQLGSLLYLYQYAPTASKHSSCLLNPVA